MAMLSPARAVGTMESVGRSGSESSGATGAGAIAGAAESAIDWARTDAAAGGLEGAGAPPGANGTEPEKAGPGVIRRRAGAELTRVAGAGGVVAAAAGSGGDTAELPAGTISSAAAAGPACSEGSAETEGIRVSAT